MRVGWLVDDVGVMGGAELTQAEFRAKAPEGVEVVDCPPGQVDDTCDRFVIHNCVTYKLADLQPLTGKDVVKYHHDVGPWLSEDVRYWLDRHTLAVCCSRIQADYMDLSADLIPPPVDLERFSSTGAPNGRSNAVSVASWGNHGKAPHRVAEWSLANQQQVDFYGGGVCAPLGSVEVAYDQMPSLLASYETFVFLPTALEPFGRVVAEAWAAGCKIVTNKLVGARYWIEERPEAIETAATDFWDVVLERVTA